MGFLMIRVLYGEQNDAFNKMLRLIGKKSNDDFQNELIKILGEMKKKIALTEVEENLILGLVKYDFHQGYDINDAFTEIKVIKKLILS